MFVTTTTWDLIEGQRNPSFDTVTTITEVAASIPGFIPGALVLDTKIVDVEVVGRVATRNWATREAAQQWADYISANYQASVTIDEVE